MYNVVIQALLRAGASFVAHDPVAMAETRRVLALDFADAPHTWRASATPTNPSKPCTAQTRWSS